MTETKHASRDGKYVGADNRVALTKVNGHEVSTIWWKQIAAGDLFETLIHGPDGKPLSDHPEIHSSEGKAIRRHAEIVIGILGVDKPVDRNGVLLDVALDMYAVARRIPREDAEDELEQLAAPRLVEGGIPTT